MAKKSSQKFIARNRAPRVQIEYDVELYGSEKKIQVPFVIGVLSDLSGKPAEELPSVDERKALEIDVDNFDSRLKAMKPRVAFTVPNTLTDEGELILPIKNVVAFAGTTVELAEFCGKRVTADGLFSTNRGVKVFALQFVREAPDGKWRRANRFLNWWAEANGVDPKSNSAQQWFRNDPTVMTIIERDGKLGTGK